MSIWGWIITIVVGIFIGSTKLPTLIRIVAAGGVGVICSFIFSSSSFTGNIQKDAEIVYERIYEDRESVDDVTNELAEFYIEEGYGMHRAKQVLMKSNELHYNRDK